MNDLESRLHDALQSTTEPTAGGLSGPALRRTARVRTYRARTGGVAALGAAGAVAVLVAPGLLSGGSDRTASVGAKPSPTAAGATKRGASGSATGKAIPVQAFVWNPAGRLIDDPAIQATAAKVAGTDSDFKAWGGTLLETDTVSVVFADRAPIDTSGPEYPRPLVIVTGRTSADSPTLRVAALTTVAGGADSTNLSSLTVDAMTTVPADGPQAIAVLGSMAAYVVAEAGVDSASYTYTDAAGDHTAAMKVANGVATVLLADLKGSGTGTVTKIKAISHGKVVWDAAPVQGR